MKVGYAEDKDEGAYVRIDKAMQGLQLSRALKAFDTAGFTVSLMLFALLGVFGSFMVLPLIYAVKLEPFDGMFPFK